MWSVFHNVMNTIQGVPYAQPPTGSNRWRNPTPLNNSAWNGVYNASIHKPLCSQGSASNPTGNEDCLYVDIYTPANVTSSSNLTVLVAVPGGGYSGTVNQVGQFLTSVSQQIIYVYVRYRPGVLGFLSTRSLSMESTGATQSSGNYGLADQQEALRWVQQHISAFGGNPQQVTIQGESAGSWSMCMHLIMPASQGLFHRMIAESGSCDQSVITHSLEQNEANGELLANAVGCPLVNKNFTQQSQCLRALNVSQLLAGYSAIGASFTNSYALNPVVDGAQVPDWPQNLFRQGQFNAVPVLMGSNYDEEQSFISAYGNLTESPITYTALGQALGWITSLPGVNSSAAKQIIAYYTNPNTVFVSETNNGSIIDTPIRTGSQAAFIDFMGGVQLYVLKHIISYPICNDNISLSISLFIQIKFFMKPNPNPIFTDTFRN
jgi:para-nitrobenzyl esterase